MTVDDMEAIHSIAKATRDEGRRFPATLQRDARQRAIGIVACGIDADHQS